MALIIIGIFFVLIINIIIIFAFPKFSPVPYFPSNFKDKDKIIASLDLQNKQTVIDLGAGDGWVIFSAANTAFHKKLNTLFVATEINPLLLGLLYWKRFFHPNKKNIQIKYFDIFNYNYQSLIVNHQSLITFYLYLSPWLILKVQEKIQALKRKKTIIAYYYALKNIRPNTIIKGENKIFLYN